MERITKCSLWKNQNLFRANLKQLGDVKAIRAVAAANGKNPIWIVIPCHRIIGSDGSLTGYAGGFGEKNGY